MPHWAFRAQHHDRASRCSRLRLGIGDSRYWASCGYGVGHGLGRFHGLGLVERDGLG